MTRSEIFEKVRSIVTKALGQPDLPITLRTTAGEIPGWDSFNHINIVVAVEAQFGITFSTAELEQLHAIGDLVKQIENKLESDK